MPGPAATAGRPTRRASDGTDLQATQEVAMEELITLVSQKTGLPPDRARTAVETVLTFVKGKLPAAIGAHLDQAVAGGGSGGGSGAGLADVAKSIGGMLGKS